MCLSRLATGSDVRGDHCADPAIGDLAAIYAAATASDDGQRCMVAPAPTVRRQVSEALQRANDAGATLPGHRVRLRPPDKLGLNDGLIIPGTRFPLGTAPSRVRRQAAERAPLRGAVRVIVVLVEFPDRKIEATAERFEDLFFSEQKLETGSVRDYFREVTNDAVDIQGAVVGPYELPDSLATYAGGDSGMRDELPNARTMAQHAAEASDRDVDFGPYDNDGNGFVDAFIVVHAGPDGAETARGGDIWSHKWVLEEEYDADTTKIFGYLTIPEDARLGVCAHELGHLLFGWPDLYDIDNSSNGLGDWCLMAGGSWNGIEQGDTPAHPSAWCKAQQSWVEVVTPTADDDVTAIPDVKDAHKVWRLWTEGRSGQEYFLVENRQRVRFDEHLPGDGLLVWHIDDSTEDNSNENHYKVALVQADGLRALETRESEGDDGDPFPGSSGNRSFNGGSSPSSNSYAGADTFVSITEISDPAPEMTARFATSNGLGQAQ